LLNTIVETLNLIVQLGFSVDHELESDKFLITCSAFKAGEAKIQFRAQIFRLAPDSSGKRCAVEYQRKSGGCIAFSEIWTTCKSYFQKNGYVSSPKRTTTFQPFDISAALEVEVSDDDIRNTIQNLLEMANSQFLDVKMEAILALTKMSLDDSKTRRVMIKEGCIDIFLQCMTSEVEDISRNAVNGLANLLQGKERESLCKQIARKGIVKTLSTVVASNETTQIKRECSRALVCLACSLGPSIIDDDFETMRKALSDSRDACIQKEIGQLNEILPLA